ncbi:MAG: hypothetical protein QME74_08410 [Candidatus Edwardsbacteria bacterium]|nr:hypothetical protein [Candidatus Edwardsbacteria bacterium]
MKRIAIVLLALILAVGAGIAQKKEPAKKKEARTEVKEEAVSAGMYKYLPEKYGSQASFTQADLIALKLTAYNSRTQRIGAKLVSLSLQADARPESLMVNCYCELVEKEKASYLGDGKFNYAAADLPAVMQDAAEFILKLTKLFFADLNDKYLVINLYMKGSLIGTWNDGKLTVLATGK